MSLCRVRVIPALILVVAAAMVATLAVPAPAPAAAAEPTFPDVEGRGYAEAVHALAERGVIRGDRAGNFNPDDRLTRGQMASILAAALDLDQVQAASADPAPFADTHGHPHEGGVAALAAEGVTNGCSDDAFCPDEPLSRAAMASLLVRAFELAPAGQRHFDDGGGVHEQAIDALAAAGIAAGCTAPVSGFCPTDQVLRWQAAYFVGRALDLVDRVELAPLAERQQLERERQERLAAEREAARRAEEEARRAAAAAERERIWDRLAQCESGGNWSINTGNGFYGGLQFTLRSWRAVGGSGYPHHHTRAEQILRAERLLAIQGWGAWPSCSRQLGLR